MSAQLLICKFAVFTCVSFFLPMPCVTRMARWLAICHDPHCYPALREEGIIRDGGHTTMMFSHYNTGLIFVPAQKRIQYSVNASSSQKKYDRKLPKAVCVTDAKDFFWSKANELHSCSFRNFKTWTIFCTWCTKCTKFDVVLTYT